MKFRIVLAAAAVAALLGLRSFAADEKKVDLEGVVCPMSGEAVSADAVAKFKGKSIYFCCENCVKGFEKDHEKVMAKVYHQLLQTHQITQVACPMSGQAMKKDKTAEVAGVSVAFCCENCQGKAKKTEGDDLIALVFGNFDKGFTLQTECPVSGKAIDISKMVEHDGQKVYFCCGNCPKAFEGDPAKYVAKVPQLQEEEAK
jgi:YHS domain-containing protein